MKFSSIKTSILAQFDTTNVIVPFVIGKPGGGKTALADEIGRELGFDRVVKFFASLRDPVDLLGTPHNSGECTRWVPPEELYQLREGRNLLILDELSDANTQMQNGLCGLILERKINNLKLSDQTYIIATGNRTEDKSGANRIVSKLSNRVRYFDFEENVDDWKSWAFANGIDPMLIAFISFRPALLSSFDPNQRCNPTPRAWFRVNLIPESILSSSLAMGNVAGEVGDGAAAEYIGFRKNWSELPDIDKLLKDTEKAKVPTDPGVLYAMMGALGQRCKDNDSLSNVYSYVRRLPAEFRVMFMQDVIKMDPKLRLTKTFVQWATENSKVFTGD